MNRSDVRIITVRRNKLTWYQVYVRGVLACEAMSEAGARENARTYIRKLASPSVQQPEGEIIHV